MTIGKLRHTILSLKANCKGKMKLSAGTLQSLAFYKKLVFPPHIQTKDSGGFLHICLKRFTENKLMKMLYFINVCGFLGPQTQEGNKYICLSAWLNYPSPHPQESPSALKQWWKWIHLNCHECLHWKQMVWFLQQFIIFRVEQLIIWSLSLSL